MERRQLTVEEANALYDVVVEMCGAHETWRFQWLSYVAREDVYRWGLEFRFQGILGFGGKLLYDGYHPAHVTCYPETRTPDLDRVIAATNERLAAVPHPHLRP